MLIKTTIFVSILLIGLNVYASSSFEKQFVESKIYKSLEQIKSNIKPAFRDAIDIKITNIFMMDEDHTAIVECKAKYGPITASNVFVLLSRVDLKSEWVITGFMVQDINVIQYFYGKLNE